MIEDTPGPHCSHRLFEWTMAIAMLGFGLHSLLMPWTLTGSRYAAVLLVLNASQFSAACLIVVSCRFLALSRNGSWPTWGPRLRALAALCAAFLWLQLAVALTQPPTGNPSPGMWVYYALAGAELRSVWRARRDGNGPRYL